MLELLLFQVEAVERSLATRERSTRRHEGTSLIRQRFDRFHKWWRGGKIRRRYNNAELLERSFVCIRVSPWLNVHDEVLLPDMFSRAPSFSTCSPPQEPRGIARLTHCILRSQTFCHWFDHLTTSAIKLDTHTKCLTEISLPFKPPRCLVCGVAWGFSVNWSPYPWNNLFTHYTLIVKSCLCDGNVEAQKSNWCTMQLPQRPSGGWWTRRNYDSAIIGSTLTAEEH